MVCDPLRATMRALVLLAPVPPVALREVFAPVNSISWLSPSLVMKARLPLSVPTDVPALVPPCRSTLLPPLMVTDWVVPARPPWNTEAKLRRSVLFPPPPVRLRPPVPTLIVWLDVMALIWPKLSVPLAPPSQA